MFNWKKNIEMKNFIIQEIQKEIDKTKGICDTYEQEIKDLKETYLSKVDDLKDAIDDLKDANEELKNSIEENNNLMKDLSKKYDEDKKMPKKKKKK
jgi:uncharacterized phage infection (PIP) family protein YhgE